MALRENIWHRLLRRPYRLEVTTAGEGKTVIVLLHGVAASAKVWTPVIKQLDPSRYRSIAPDLLGFGDSPKPQWPQYSVHDHARAVRAALRRQGVRTPAIIMGHSMGCLVAAHIAATHPAQVQRLILYEPPLMGELPDFPSHSRRSRRYRAFFEYIASHPQLAHIEARLLWRTARKLWGTHLTDEQWLPFERSLRNTILAQQAYSDLRDTRIPTDIIYGRLDVVVIRRGIKKMFAHNKHVALHRVTDFHGISRRSARYLVNLLPNIQPTGNFFS